MPRNPTDTRELNLPSATASEKVACACCGGNGEIHYPDLDFTCPLCFGTGRVHAEENMTWDEWHDTATRADADLDVN